MSIASRITAITGHITDIYDTLELGGDTTQNKNIVNINTEIKREYKNFLAHGTDELWNNWEKVSGTGETLTLNNTLEAKMKVDLKGNTYQYSTTGKNLFNPSNFTPKGNVSITSDGVISSTEISSDSWSYANSQYKDTLQAGTYTLKVYFDTEETNTWGGITIYDSNNQALYNNYDIANVEYITKTFTINQATNIGIMFKLKVGVCRCQLEKSSSATPYEPYTGGIPSPNPDYPQDIQVVSGDNTLKVEGKNLLNLENAQLAYINASYQVISNNYNVVTDYLRIESNTNYYFSVQSSVVGTGIVIYDKNKTALYRNGAFNINNAITYNFGDDNYGYIRLWCNVTNSSTSVNAFLEKQPMLERGQKTTTYQAYTGTTYPINLSVENLYDNESQTYSVARASYVLENNGLKITSAGNYAMITSNFDVEIGKTYTMSFDTINNDNIAAGVQIRSSSALILYGGSSTGHYALTFTPTENKVYFRFYSNTTDTSTTNIVKYYNIQIELGTKANQYTPYGTMPVELCKIGTYQDSIVKDNGKWYLNKQIGKVVLDGSESWESASSPTGTARFYYDNATYYNSGLTSDNVYALSPQFKGLTWANIYSGDTTTKNAIALYDSQNKQGRLVLRIDNTYANSVATFKTWLSTHNTEVYYVLATPTTTEITDTTLLSQLEALAYSYEGTTNISQVNDDLASELDVVALEDI